MMSVLLLLVFSELRQLITPTIGKIFRQSSESITAIRGKNRGGWPQSVGMRDEIALDQASDYYDAVVHSDVNRADNVQKNPERVRRLMRSYARNQGGHLPNTVLAQDIAADNETPINEETVASYVNALRKIFVVEDTPA